MGKKRIIKKSSNTQTPEEARARLLSRLPKKKLNKAVLHIEATFNNTKMTLADEAGNVILWGSAGVMGFKGTRKSTPYAAAKIAAALGEKAKIMGLKTADIIVKGVGSGRESAIRSFVGAGVEILKIKDKTPIPFNGPKPPKPRRV